MAQFSGRIKTKDNKLTNVKVQARSLEEANHSLGRKGRVVKIKKNFSIDAGGSISAADRQIFYARLGSMLASRVGTSDALQIMRDSFKGKISTLSAKILSQVEMGDDLALAIEKIGPPNFPEATVALIKAGVRTGESGKALKDAADFEHQLHVISKTASSGIYTGVGSLIFAGVLTLVSTFYVGPQITESPLIKMANVDIQWINDIALYTAYAIGLILFVLFCLFMLSTVIKRIVPLAADNIIMRIPFYKDMVLAKNNFVSFYGLALLIKSGVRMEEALRLGAEAAPRGALRVDLQRAQNAVQTGKPWPTAMNTLHPTDRAALLCATDRTQIALTLDTLASTYRELYALRIAIAVPSLNLLAALFMSIAGGILFGQSILPMLMAAQTGMGT